MLDQNAEVAKDAEKILRMESSRLKSASIADSKQLLKMQDIMGYLHIINIIWLSLRSQRTLRLEKPQLQKLEFEIWN